MKKTILVLEKFIVKLTSKEYSLAVMYFNAGIAQLKMVQKERDRKEELKK